MRRAIYCEVYACTRGYENLTCQDIRSNETYLGRGNTDFGTSVNVDTTVCLTRQSRTYSVDNTKTEGTSLQTIPECKDGIGSLSTLTDKHTDIISENRSLPVQEIRRQLDTDWDLGQFFKDRPGRKARMVTRSASGEHDPAATTHDGQVRSQPSQSNLVRIKVDTTTHGVDDRLGLLVNLLLHKVVEFAFHDRSDLDLEGLDATSRGNLAGSLGFIFLTPETVDMEFTLGDMGDVIVLKVEDTLGVFYNCCCV